VSAQIRHQGQAGTLRLLGEIASGGNIPEVEQAEADYRQVLTVGNELGFRPRLAYCHHSVGTLCAKTGRREQARADLSTPLELYHVMNMTF
jgi:hypothetical protein